MFSGVRSTSNHATTTLKFLEFQIFSAGIKKNSVLQLLVVLAFVTIDYGRAPLGSPPHVTLTQPSH
jgi:hypothetical protein